MIISKELQSFKQGSGPRREIMQETLYSTLRIGHQDRVITLQLFDKRTIDACVFWWESGKIFAKS